MSSRKIMSIIGLGLNALLIIFLFLPFIQVNYGQTENLWYLLKIMSGEEIAYIYLVELIIAIVFLILQICGVLKDTKLAMVPTSFIFTVCLAVFFLGMNNNRLEYFEFGLYLNLIVAIASLVILGIGGLLSNEKKASYGYSQKPVGFDPQTGKPIYEAPKTIVGYDPQTGAPIYK